MPDSRPAQQLRKVLFLGLDLGGQHIKMGFGTGDAVLEWKGQRSSAAAQGRAEILDSLCQGVEEGQKAAAERGGTLHGIGVGTPGVVEAGSGRVRYDVSNLPEWGGVDLPRLFQERFQLPTWVENDANLAAFGEARWGAARDLDPMVLVTVGTGIGGGAVLDGKLLRGSHGAGMELGHIPLERNGRRCGCGKRGCLEAHAGGRALLEIWEEEMEKRSLSLSLSDLMEAANQDQGVARRVLEEGAEHLGVGLVAVLHLLNPACLVIGGGIADGCPWFVERVEAKLRERALPSALDPLVVRRAQFGNWAGVIGAVSLAREQGA
ncbi:MAG: ROK family protein [Planctomycetota bacterium]